MDKIFKGKKILVTGHTGFKGSWLAVWLNELGAEVYGLSLDVPTKPAHYDLFENVVAHEEFLNISDDQLVRKYIQKISPEFVFHLAAQPIVLDSYSDPLKTFYSNSIGTANILDSLRLLGKECIAIMITSDKCYDNQELTRGYSEEDRLGGKDPYSGSKGAAELIIRSYSESFFKKEDSPVRLAIGRAGNVIGGGDWAPHRIVPDCIRAWSKEKNLEIRNPHSTRPWQHVLEPLSGYLFLAQALKKDATLTGEAFNFGPSEGEEYTVGDLVNELSLTWKDSSWSNIGSKESSHYEAGLLKLNCEKAENLLNWKPRLSFQKTAEWTGDWYYHYYRNSKNVFNITKSQIKEYMKLI